MIRKEVDNIITTDKFSKAGLDAERQMAHYLKREFADNPKIRFVDILFCEGGCINGPGITSALPVNERKNKVLEYAHSPT